MPVLDWYPDGNNLCSPFDIRDLQSALKSVKPNSAPGDDGIDYLILRRL